MKVKKKQEHPDSLKEKLSLYRKMMSGKASSHDLVRLSLLKNMISKEQYEDFLEIEKEYGVS